MPSGPVASSSILSRLWAPALWLACCALAWPGSASAAPDPKVALAAPALSDPKVLEDVVLLTLRLPATTLVRVQPTLDETVAQIVLSIAPPDLETQLLAWKQVHWMALPAPTGTEATVLVALPHPIVQMRQSRAPGRAHIEVQTAHTATTLRQRIVQPIPSLDVAPEDARLLREAEVHLAQPGMVAARRALTPLLARYPIQSWVQLRMADAAFLADGPVAACGLYDDVADRYADRMAGVVAALRMFALECPQEHTPLVWTTLLKRTNADDPTGRWLGEEARWALQSTQQVGQILAALSWGEKTLGRQLWRRLLSRMVHIATPLQVATLSHIWQVPLAAHPDAAGLRLWIAHSWCQLELPDRALKAISAGEAAASPWAHSARACASLAPMWPRRPGAPAAAIAAKITDLDDRLAAAERAAKVLDPKGHDL